LRSPRAFRRQTLRGRIRLAVVTTTTASAALVSVTGYLVARATWAEGSAAETDRSLILLALALMGASLIAAVAGALASRWVASGVAGPVARVSAAARQIAERIDPTGDRPAADSEEIEVLAASFNQMAAGLERRIQRERRFVANVSHELRTPLTALQASADVLAARREELPPTAAEAAELVVDRSRHMVRLVIELMELTELDSGKAPIRWEAVDVRALLVALLARRGRSAPVQGDGLVTYSDKARLDRILGNLIDNAYEHGDGRGVEVSIRSQAREIVVAVADQGPGIPPEDVPHLFESFFKSGRSRARGRGGVGMGLPIAYENARLLGGRIAVESEIGRGTTLTLHLPLHTSVPPAEPAMEEGPQASRAS
jgi:two-component system sensor histidine kinase MtrB